MEYPHSVERWGVFEVRISGPSEGNPFVERAVAAVFTSRNETARVDGFYDGEGRYAVRFMPSFEEPYRFLLEADWLDGTPGGSFLVTPPRMGNRGPVYVANTFHFAYADGAPFYPAGTTCYAWTYQPDEMKAGTLETLRRGYFNKLRFCVFPKHYDFNFRDPAVFPYVGAPCDNSGITHENFESYTPRTPGNRWDFFRPNPAYFQNIEACVRALMNLGVQADLILLHPYDRWGFSQMPPEADDLYVRYAVARFAAFRNVWWSLANEYDLMAAKTVADWERIAQILCDRDPYRRLRSIHNCFSLYDYSRPWITHASIQRQEVYKCAELTDEYRLRFKKPVVIDENAYEGNLPLAWGNISAQEMVRRFWETTVRGGYATHGETYLNGDGVLWWSHGGKLRGESPERIRFLMSILNGAPGHGLKPCALHIEEPCAVPEGFGPVRWYLLYYGFCRPGYREFHLDDLREYVVDVIDTWNMTISRQGPFRGGFRVEMPGREYMALRIQALDKD